MALESTTCEGRSPAEGEQERMSKRVRVKVLLLVGDQAEIVADIPPEERAQPMRYPVAEIAEAVGLEARKLPGTALTADVGPDDRLSGWQLV